VPGRMCNGRAGARSFVDRASRKMKELGG